MQLSRNLLGALAFGVVLLALAVSGAPDLHPASAPAEKASARSARYDERKFGPAKHLQSLSQMDDKKDIKEFATSKNMIRTLVKLLFGSDEESQATSRQILNILVHVLEMLKNSLGQRGGTAREARDGEAGQRSIVDKAAISGAAMLQGYVKSVLANSTECIQKYMCEASNVAVKEGDDVGYVVSQVTGYVASYLLETQKAVPLQANLDATRKGRSGQDDCFAALQACKDGEQ